MIKPPIPPPPFYHGRMVSRFKDAYAKKPVNDTPLSQVLHEIKDGTYREPVENLRKEYRDHGKSTKYTNEKKLLPAFTTSGRCNGRQRGLIAHSGLIQAALFKPYERGKENNLMQWRRVSPGQVPSGFSFSEVYS